MEARQAFPAFQWRLPEQRAAATRLAAVATAAAMTRRRLAPTVKQQQQQQLLSCTIAVHLCVQRSTSERLRKPSLGSSNKSTPAHRHNEM